jgi:hypothetical protein
MHLSGFDRCLWAASFFGEIVLLAVLFVRRRAHSFPAFTTWVAENICSTIVLYIASSHFSIQAYRSSYKYLNLVDACLQLFVVYEVAVHVFRPTGVWARDVLKTFWGVVSLSVASDFFLAWLNHPAVQTPVLSFILRTNFFSALLMSELFVGMIVLASTAGLPWKTHVARVAQGLGTFSISCVAADIVVSSVAVGQHMQLYTALSHLKILTYLGCEVFWIAMLWREAPAPRELPEKMRAQIYTLQRRVEYDLIRIRSWRRS